MVRAVRLERAFIFVLRGQGRPAYAAVVREIAWLSRQQLPGHDDYEAFVYPVGVAWVRKVSMHSLWIFYSFERDELDVRWLRATEPRPAEPT